MKRFKQHLVLFAALTGSALLLTGCQTNYVQQRQHIPAEVKTDKPIEGRPTLGTPIMVADAEFSVVPFTVDRPKRWLEDADRFEAESMSKVSSSTVSAYASRGGTGGIGLTQSVRWHNAIIQPDQGAGQLVLNQKGVISQFDVVGHWVEDEKEDEEDKTTYTFERKAILFLATLQDTDGDKQLTRSDANVLYAANADGKGLHPITPANRQVQMTRYNAERNLIVIMLAADTNGDGLFTQADSAAPYIYTPGSDGGAKPLVDPQQAKRAEQLLK